MITYQTSTLDYVSIIKNMVLPIGFSALAIELPPSQRTRTGFEPVITYQRSTLDRNQEYVIANRDTFVFTNDTLPRVYALEHDVDPDMYCHRKCSLSTARSRGTPTLA